MGPVGTKFAVGGIFGGSPAEAEANAFELLASDIVEDCSDTLGGGGGNVETDPSCIGTSVDGETAGDIDRLRAAAIAGALLTVAFAT